MPGDEVAQRDAPEEVPQTAIPAPLAERLPKRLHATAHDLLSLPAGDRAKVFNAFGKTPPKALATFQQTVVQASMWQGPLPSPEHLERFNQIIPGGAERILAMAERQQQHRMDLERHAVPEQLRQSSRGQIFALLIGFGGIGLAAYLGYRGFATQAASVGGVTLAGLAIAFVTGRASQSSPPKEKPPKR